MLKPETIKKIAETLKIKESDLATAIKDEKEVDVAIPEGLTVFTDAELESRDENNKREGEKTGREKGIKEVKKAAGLPEDAPSKDPAKVAQAIVDKAVADAKVKPDEKVTQLTEQVNLLQSKLGEKDTELETVRKTAAEATLNSRILAAFPKERDSKLTDDEYLALIRSKHTFKEQDGKIIVEKDGKPLRDAKTQNPLALDEALKTVFTERKWTAEPQVPAGGRGGNGTPRPAGSKYTKLSELKEEFTSQGKSLLGAEFNDAVMKARAENKDLDMSA